MAKILNGARVVALFPLHVIGVLAHVLGATKDRRARLERLDTVIDIVPEAIVSERPAWRVHVAFCRHPFWSVVDLLTNERWQIYPDDERRVYLGVGFGWVEVRDGAYLAPGTMVPTLNRLVAEAIRQHYEPMPYTSDQLPVTVIPRVPLRTGFHECG